MKTKKSIIIDDDDILDMDPVHKMWLYENWLADQNDDAELAKNHAYLLASFWDPEAVKQITGNNNSHVSSDDEFEESSKMVREGMKLFEKSNESPLPDKRRRRARKIIA